MLRKIIVVEVTHNSEAGKATLIHNARHLPDAMNPHFIANLIGRRDKNLNPDLAPSWRKSLAADERSIERNIASEAALRLLATVVPVEDDWKAQPVSHSGAALRIEFHGS